MDTLIQELEQSAKSQKEGPLQRDLENKKGSTPSGGKSKLWLILGGGLLIAAVAGSAAYLHFRDQISTDDAQVDAHIAPIAPKISGNIVQILVDDNEPVKAGQLLLQIDPRDYEAKVAQARAAVAAAESEATGARAGVPLITATTASGSSVAEAQLAAASAELDGARANYERAASSEVAFARADVEAKRATADRTLADRKRMEPLAAQDEISKQQFDGYIAAARVAESEYNAALQKLANAEKQAQSSKSSVDAAIARVAAARAGLDQAHANRQQVNISSASATTASAAVLQARANLEAAELQLSYTKIVAPVDGVVTRKSVQLGQIVQPGQSLMTIVPLQDVWVTANFKETQLASVKKGQRAEVHVDMYGRSFQGHVDSVAGATGTKLSLLPPENATGNYVKVVQRIPVKIVLDKVPSDFTFRPGINVDATIFTK
jgi:membrane fusion protein (multidrug efflux system)